MGYVAQDKKVTGAGKTLNMNVVLKEETQQLSEVVVTALGNQTRRKSVELQCATGEIRRTHQSESS